MLLRFHPLSGRPRIRVARVYDDPGPDDGERVLVDRLWPRGFRKKDPRVGRWIPNVYVGLEIIKVIALLIAGVWLLAT